MIEFTRYLSLGDSISIDSYPSHDLGYSEIKPVGAASLLHQNDDELWPEFTGRDLRTLYPTLRFQNLASDAATTSSLLLQLEPVEGSPERTLITLTIGGNDLLASLHETAYPFPHRNPKNPVKGILKRIEAVVNRVEELFPDSVFILSSIYDPSDGTNVLPGLPELTVGGEWLTQLNEGIRSLAEEKHHFFADLHHHFLGHGVTASTEEDLWYWPENIIEPGGRGAAEVRRLWWECVEVMNG